MPSFLNPALITNWENWVRIFLMVAIGAVIVHYTGQLLNSKKGE